MASIVLCGIFVGGAGSRMGGVPKGLLPSGPQGPNLVERLIAELRRGLNSPELVLVGARPEYASLGLEIIADAITGIGPLGGLEALLSTALQRNASHVLALACDMPYVTAPLLARLVNEQPDAAALAPRLDGRWQPLCARYAVVPASSKTQQLLARGERALFRVLEELNAVELAVNAAERAELDDWDEPADVLRRRH